MVSQHAITGAVWNCASGVLFLKKSVLAGDFTNILFPLATNLSTFG
jgi:hypothetical protein